MYEFWYKQDRKWENSNEVDGKIQNEKRLRSKRWRQRLFPSTEVTKAKNLAKEEKWNIDRLVFSSVYPIGTGAK